MELCSMLCANLDGSGVWGKMNICICMAESLCCSPETTNCLSTILQYKNLVLKKIKKNNLFNMDLFQYSPSLIMNHLPFWGVWEGIVTDFGKVMCTLLYLKWITNKDLLYSTWNSAQCYVPAWMGGEFGEKGYIYIYIWLSPSAVHLKLSQHCQLALVVVV